MLQPLNLLRASAMSAWYALCNRARGSQLYGLTDSTVIGRLASTLGMALSNGLFFNLGSIIQMEIAAWSWASLMLWCTFAWDKFWSAMLGNDPNHSKLWGLGWMALRQSLAVVEVIGGCWLTGNLDRWWLALATPLLAVPYIIYGIVAKKTPILDAELTDGAMLGIINYMVMA